MAFSFDFLNKAAFNRFPDRTQNQLNGETNGKGLEIFTYNASATGANDTAAATQGANYFNGANGYLLVGDTIIVQSNDPAYHILNVTVIAAGVVTVAQVI